jgi:leucyl aminopeptidase
MDIAGPAWLDAKEDYRTQGGTGAGVRLLYTFLKNY